MKSKIGIRRYIPRTMLALAITTLPCLLAAPSRAADSTGIEVDKEKKTVAIDAKIAPRKMPYLDQIYPIEVIACFAYNGPKKGEKAHETVVTIEATPSEVHKALESLGLNVGKPADLQNDKPAEGPVLNVYIEFNKEDGSKKRVLVNQILLDIKNGKPLPKSVKFHFTGSEMVQIDPAKPEKSYGADQSGTLIAIFPVTGKTVMQSTLTMKEEKYVKLETDKKVLPKEGMPVKLILEVPN
jgi:hypothetical protein